MTALACKLCYRCDGPTDDHAYCPRCREERNARAAARLSNRVCKNCRRRRFLQGRGLCKPCWLDPAVRGRFPVKADTRREGVPDQPEGVEQAPPVPTAAGPGTPEKVATLCGRAEAGLCLFHALDNRGE